MKKPAIYISLLLLCGALAYYFVPRTGGPAKPASETAPAEESNSESVDSTAAPKNGPIFVRLDPIILPVLGTDGPQQLVTLVVFLHVANEEDEDKVKAQEPRLKDAFLSSLYGALDNGSVRHGRLVDISKVKQKLQQACDGVMGPDVVKDVLVQNIVQRQFR